MKKLTEILRLTLQSELSIRATQRVLVLSVGAIQNIVSQARTLNLTWEKIQSLDEPELTKLGSSADSVGRTAPLSADASTSRVIIIYEAFPLALPRLARNPGKCLAHHPRLTTPF